MISEYRIQSRRRVLLDHYAKVVVSSRHMQREYERQGLAPDRVALVPLPVEGDSAAAPPIPRPGTNRVLFVGRLTALKGCRELVHALPIASRVLGTTLRLVVAGDGPERPHIDTLARRIGVELEFVGWVDASQRDILMSNADVLAVPSLWPEPFGLVGVEAGLVGLPAVAYAMGGIPEWLEPGISGELADRLSVASLADALIRALRDPEHLNRLRLGAWESARRYTMATHMVALEPILANVLLKQEVR
jgi:glycosyltransferase involved in cell wall biosynthesis